MIKETTESRLPAGSTLEIAPGVHVAHPHAEVNLPGKPTGRYLGSDAVTETALTQAVTGGELKPLGAQKPLACEVVPGTLATTDSNVVVHVKEGHDATDLLADQVAATGVPAVVGDVKVLPTESEA